MSILTVERVTAGYEKAPVIRDLTFAVPGGGITGVVGPNGAGKTTLFRTISRILKPWSGTVRFRGDDISGMPRREFARRVAVIPQFRMIPPPFTVEEFVSLGRYPHIGRLSPLKQQDRRIIAKILELLGLAHIRTRKVNALSGGEMQRAYLAQGLVQTPELLLMDEPTAHLDISQKIRVLDLIDSLSETVGLSVLVILHDLNLASGYCNRVLMLEKGEIRAAGTPEEVLTRRTIEEVYRTPVRVGKDPMTARPHIYFLPRSSAVRRDGPRVSQTEKTNGVLTKD